MKREDGNFGGIKSGKWENIDKNLKNPILAATIVSLETP